MHVIPTGAARSSLSRRSLARQAAQWRNRGSATASWLSSRFSNFILRVSLFDLCFLVADISLQYLTV
jgi:hypothetical protein